MNMIASPRFDPARDKADAAHAAWRMADDGSKANVLQTYEARRDALVAFAEITARHEADMADALHRDMGRGAAEAWTSELTTLSGEIDHALANLKNWMKPERASVPVKMWPAKASIRHEPKGTALVIGAWNLPFAVTLTPAVASLAAGNSTVCKPSELAPASAQLMAKLVTANFDPAVLQVVEGDATTTQSLLEHRWGHVFYTGSEGIGRKVAVAAADQGSPVTLELGGKCPAYVHASADIDVAAKRVVWAKFMNAGQVCIAPDYVIVDKVIQSEFEEACVKAIGDLYGDQPKQSSDFARIINERHFRRLEDLLQTTTGRIIAGGECIAEERYIAPTILSDLT